VGAGVSEGAAVTEAAGVALCAGGVEAARVAVGAVAAEAAGDGEGDGDGDGVTISGVGPWAMAFGAAPPPWRSSTLPRGPIAGTSSRAPNAAATPSSANRAWGRRCGRAWGNRWFRGTAGLCLTRARRAVRWCAP